MSTRKNKRRSNPGKVRKNDLAKRTSLKKSKGRRRLVTGIFAILVLAGLSATGIASLKKGWEQERDLDVIGNGKPTIVQVHDTSCKLCRTLKKNTELALTKHFADKFQYRIADINTSKGRKFQRNHEVSHVTLVLFDGGGKRRMTLSGVKESGELQRYFDSFLASRYREN